MKPQTQTLLAERQDGHTAAGLPGNCIQAAVASLLELDVEGVPHFAVYVDWFGAMRRWARERGGDFTYFEFPVPEQYAAAWDTVVDWGREHGSHLLLSGPSPRGPFWHVVVGNVDLEVTHDPHPSRAGLVEVRDAIVYCSPYDPPPRTLELPTRQETTMPEPTAESDGGSEITIPAHWARDSDGNWHHVGVIFGGQATVLYIDGVSVVPPAESAAGR